MSDTHACAVQLDVDCEGLAAEVSLVGQQRQSVNGAGLRIIGINQMGERIFERSAIRGTKIARSGQWRMHNRGIADPGGLAVRQRRVRIVHAYHDHKAAMVLGGIEVASGILIETRLSRADEAVRIPRELPISDVPFDLAAVATNDSEAMIPVNKRPARPVRAAIGAEIAVHIIAVIALLARLNDRIAAHRRRRLWAGGRRRRCG